MTLVIGLTGGIASGKSTVANMLIEKGITVIDADIIAKQAVEKGMPAYRQIIDEFGEDILLSNGDIDRKKLGALVFTNEQKRLALNAIVHPAVRQEMLKRRDEAVANREAFVVLDIPLLFESKLESLVDKIIVVSVTKEPSTGTSDEAQSADGRRSSQPYPLSNALRGKNSKSRSSH